MGESFDLINKHKVCNSCGEISGPYIERCPKCAGDDFRPLTKEEIDGQPKKVFELDGPSLISSSAYDEGSTVVCMTNAFVL